MGSRYCKLDKKLISFALLICFLMSGAFYILSPFPKDESNSINLPKKFETSINTKYEIQGKNQCAAFSTAFILRNFDNDAKGLDIYEEIPYKIPISGYVLPKGIIVYLQSQGLKASILKGNINSLQSKLVEQNNPVIVLVGNRLFWQHYMVLLGYDNSQRELYFFDSGRKRDENAALPGNRTMKIGYFLKWWDNGLPIFNHVYIVTEKAL